MSIRILSESLINQIAAGEVVERPASVVKELVENALDAGATEISADVIDGGRTLISVIDNGSGMTRENLSKSIMRHATSKLPDDDLLNISFMGFRGEALPSIASVSDMTIDSNGSQLNCTTCDIKPSAWESGTRMRVENLFAKTPARLKFLRTDRAEMMSVVEIIKRLALSRPDVGFTLNDKWKFVRGQSLFERVVAVLGSDVKNFMLEINHESNGFKLSGFISEPTMRRASSIDQYLFVNGRPVKDKVLVGALRAAYMDVMSAREFPLCALYLEMPKREVDVNVSPAKTEVHFLEPARVRGFIIKTLRDALARTMLRSEQIANSKEQINDLSINFDSDLSIIKERAAEILNYDFITNDNFAVCSLLSADSLPLGKAIGQIGNKYIIAENDAGLVIVDQHAAHERITYERLRMHEIKAQPLLFPIVVGLRPEDISAVSEVIDELELCGLKIEQFGEDAIAISSKPADWDLDFTALLHSVAQEVMADGHSSKLHEKLHLKLANYACHHSVRAGQSLSMESMNALLRDIERTEHGGECNHGRPVYKIIRMGELDGWFER